MNKVIHLAKDCPFITNSLSLDDQKPYIIFCHPDDMEKVSFMLASSGKHSEIQVVGAPAAEPGKAIFMERSTLESWKNPVFKVFEESEEEWHTCDEETSYDN